MFSMSELMKHCFKHLKAFCTLVPFKKKKDQNSPESAEDLKKENTLYVPFLKSTNLTSTTRWMSSQEKCAVEKLCIYLFVCFLFFTKSPQNIK